uniref:Methyltransferase domain-containing protein n=1 Tax=Fervidicoccus fontis TaxID=683846 RepID=A0A7J3ZJ04_9CREN
MKRSLYYLVYSGKHPCLSKLEAYSLLEGCRFLLELTQLAVFEVESLSGEDLINVQRRSSTIKEIGKVLGIATADSVDSFKALLREALDSCPGREVLVKFTRIQSVSRSLRKLELIRAMRERLRELCVSNVEVKECKREWRSLYSIVLSDGIVLLGKVLSRERKYELLTENPHDLPCYRPGALTPWFSRLLANIAVGRKRFLVLLDPFCGTGSIPLQAMKANQNFVICGELRKDGVYCAKINLDLLGEGVSEIVRWDALRVPLREGSIDAIVTDLPYGRSTRGLVTEERQLAQQFVERLHRILKRGGRAVVVAPAEWRLSCSPNEKVALRYKCPMYVHSTLTREILVYEVE